MSAVREEAQPASGISIEQVHQARLRAAGEQRSWTQLLQDELGLQPAELVDALAQMSGIHPIPTESLLSLIHI